MDNRPTREDIEAMWTPALVRKYPEKAFEVMTRLAALPEEPDPAVIEAMARALAHLESDEDWPTNADLGGGPTGTRDDEYRDSCRDDARAAYAALRGAIQ